MQNEAFTIEEMRSSSSQEAKILASYFKDYSKNNLSINKVVSFAIDDLAE